MLEAGDRKMGSVPHAWLQSTDAKTGKPYYVNHEVNVCELVCVGVFFGVHGCRRIIESRQFTIPSTRGVCVEKGERIIVCVFVCFYVYIFL